MILADECLLSNAVCNSSFEIMHLTAEGTNNRISVQPAASVMKESYNIILSFVCFHRRKQ